MKPLTRDKITGNRKFPIKVLQFGGGNFLRAFSGWIVEVLNEQTTFDGDIAIVKPTSQGSYSLLKQQQGLYHVLLKGLKGGEEVTDIKRIHCVREIVNPYTHWEDYLKLAELESIRFVISNTTESGIQFDANALSSENPPAGFPAKLTRWLYHRYQFFNGAGDRGCIFLPCELISENGKELYSCINEHAMNWKLESGFSEWLKNANFFCNTLVDRIVSGFPKEDSAGLDKQLGFHDALLVSGELYHSWIIQGPDFLANEFPTEQTGLNVQFVHDLRPYREMKVRILNGCHSLMVPVGYLMGFRYVHECMQDATMFNFLEMMLSSEICPTLDLPADEVHAFKEDTISRFRNPSLRHQLMSIALNSVSKFGTRVIPTLLAYYNTNRQLPPRIVLSMAAQLCFYSGSTGGKKIKLNDSPETIGFFSEIWRNYDATPEGAALLVSRVLTTPWLWPANLGEIPGLSHQLAGNVFFIERHGMAAAIKRLG